MKISRSQTVFLPGALRVKRRSLRKQTIGTSPSRREAVVYDVPCETTSNPVPYDENLLERARTQWQFGDWEILAKLDRDTLQHHPDRAKLALLAAAGNLQKNDPIAAKQFARLAVDWGCPRGLASRVLISGVYNTLGRAAAIGQQPARSFKNFERAISVGAPASDSRLLIQARMREQFQQLGLNEPALGGSTEVALSALARPPAISQAMKQISEQITAQKAALDAQISKQSSEMLNLRKFVESSLKKEVLNATKQIEAFVGLQTYFNTGDLIPDMHGWPISPDFALLLIELLETNDYDLVIEFGSGTSTILIAKTLKNVAARRATRAPVKQLAFEHQEKYFEQTLAGLKQAGHAEAVQLVLSPLVPYVAPNGNTYPYYDCQQTLSDVAKSSKATASRILVLVDGPPGTTGRHARYPALPVVMSGFLGSTIDLLLDDYIRADEKEVAQVWLQDIKTLGMTCSVVEKNLEKGAVLINVIS